jgi:hypothetical protein
MDDNNNPIIIRPHIVIIIRLSLSSVSKHNMWLYYDWVVNVHSLLPLCLVWSMLSVSLDCPFLIAPVSCVTNVISVSRLSILDCPCVLCDQCCQSPQIVHSWLPLCLVWPMLSVSLDCPFLIAPVSCVTNVVRVPDNIGHTRHRGNQEWTI